MSPQVCLTPNPVLVIQPHSVLAKTRALGFLLRAWPWDLVLSPLPFQEGLGLHHDPGKLCSRTALKNSDQLLEK